MEILIPVIVILTAYFVKGLSGFGPALIMMPFLAIIYDPATAIITTTVLDFLAGSVLTYQIRHEINWRFVIPIIIMMSIGAALGAYLLGKLPVNTIKQIMGVVIIIFALYILIAGDTHSKGKKKYDNLKYPVGVLSGFLGGLLNISGPPLVIFMKICYPKSFFRSQLIVIFLFGAAWRLVLYYINNITLNLNLNMILLFILVMLAGVIIGHKTQLKISDKFFNRIVAGIVLVTAIRMLIS